MEWRQKGEQQTTHMNICQIRSAFESSYLAPQRTSPVLLNQSVTCLFRWRLAKRNTFGHSVKRHLCCYPFKNSFKEQVITLENPDHVLKVFPEFFLPWLRPAHSGWNTILRNERAGDRIRTGDNQLGKLVLYQLSYARKVCGLRFSHVLYIKTGTILMGTIWHRSEARFYLHDCLSRSRVFII